MKTFNIGRDPENQIRLNDSFVSRKHAQLIILDSNQVLLKDLGSSNGTFINGNKITEAYLNHGDIVKCGNQFLDWQKIIYSNHQPVVAATNNDNPNSSFSDDSKQPRSGNEKKLLINQSISDELPAMVRNELAGLSAQKQSEFIEEYNRKKKSVAISYIFQIFILWMHYGYLRKWGLQFVFWLTAGGLGFWWFIDLFRNYGMVKDYNKEIAIEVIRNLKAISDR